MRRYVARMAVPEYIPPQKVVAPGTVPMMLEHIPGRRTGDCVYLKDRKLYLVRQRLVEVEGRAVRLPFVTRITWSTRPTFVFTLGVFVPLTFDEYIHLLSWECVGVVTTE